jgi:tripartite-type tricarboxylate transporter receptor subunit TctC
VYPTGGIHHNTRKEKGGYGMHKKWILVGIAFFLISSLGLVPLAQGVDFSGKTIKWIIPFGVGGGSDVWARLYAPFFQKYLPGKPTVAVQNMPGGGSMRVKADGLTAFGSSGSTSFPYLLGASQVKYDFAKYHIVFASPTGGVAYIKPEFGVKSAKDLKGFKEKLAYASQGATSLDIIPLLSFEMLGLDVKAVFGYKGRGPGRVAFEQGETNIDYQTTTAFPSHRPRVGSPPDDLGDIGRQGECSAGSGRAGIPLFSGSL